MINTQIAVLGSILVGGNKILDDINLVPSDFQDLKLGRVYKSMLDMKANGEAIDAITIAAKFPEYKLDVWNWQNEALSVHNVSHYAQLVRDDAILAEVKITAQTLVANSDTNLDAAIDEARRNLGTLASSRTTGKVEYVSHLAEGHFDYISQPRTFIPSPWASLNQAISGFRPGALYIVGARPGVGKTIVGLQTAYHLSKEGPVSFHSLEMSKSELLNRMYAQTSGVFLGNIEKNKLSDYDWKQLTKAKEELATSNLAIIDKGTQTLNDIRGHARTLQQNGGLRAIVVDYLGLIHDPIPGRKRYESISDFSQSLKALARDMEVPVIALAQLNRQSENRIDRSPALSDLRDSGAIEQDADVVILLRREKNPNDQAWEQSQIILDVAKNRHGMTGEISLTFHGGLARVEE